MKLRFLLGIELIWIYICFVYYEYEESVKLDDYYAELDKFGLSEWIYFEYYKIIKIWCWKCNTLKDFLATIRTKIATKRSSMTRS